MRTMIAKIEELQDDLVRSAASLRELVKRAQAEGKLLDRDGAYQR